CARGRRQRMLNAAATATLSLIAMALAACSPDALRLSTSRAAHWVQTVCGATLSSIPEMVRGTEQLSGAPHAAKRYVDTLVRVSAADLDALRQSLDSDPHAPTSGLKVPPIDPAMEYQFTNFAILILMPQSPALHHAPALSTDRSRRTPPGKSSA